MAIKIYQDELAVAGLAEKIRSQNSIAYLAPIIYTVSTLENKAIAETIDKVCLASENDFDLYITKSILVTTNCNKNDDVFDSKEVWAARHTPIDKPTNIDHDEHKICGHITKTWAIDDDGKIIPDNTNVDELPSLYHLVNAAVIYKHWEDDELVDRTEKLIAEIQEGKRFVSMEALFSNFDYYVIKANEDPKIIERSESTAWMTKYLRAYGGSGKYEDNKICRLLRNMVFSGKGYVLKPANPNSIIFASEKKDEDLNKCGVYLDEREIKGDNMTLEELTVKYEELEAKLKIAEKELEDSKAELKVKADELSQRDSKINELAKSNSELTEQINQVKAAELRTNRITVLVAGGIEKDLAEKKVDIFANLNDEQFGVISEELIFAAKTVKDSKKVEANVEQATKNVDEVAEDNPEDDAAAEVVDDQNLENVEENVDPSLSVASTEEVNSDELDGVREELAKAIASAFGIK